MSVKIGSNISSLQAQRRLGEASSALSVTYERLSSGQRINRASDDAAGLAISQSLNTRRRVFNQAVRNVNDGVSMFSIAEGAVSQLKGLLIRERELATQASNGTYSLSQRQALDKERMALEDEYNRIIKSTEFNGRKVFDESQGALVLQAGYGENGSLQAAADNTLDFTGLPLRLSTSSAGNQGTSNSVNYGISSDGRYTVFQSNATNLVTGDTNATGDIFIKDALTGETRRVSTDSAGIEATGGVSNRAKVTPDGRYVVFESNATNLISGDTNGQRDIFVKDILTGEARRVNTDSFGNQAAGGLIASSFAHISADGRYVVFQSAATNLVSGDTNAQEDIFLKDLLTGETSRVNVDGFGTQAAGGASNNAMLTPDARYVIFDSDATNLVSGDTNGQGDVFVKDLLTEEIRLVSVNDSGNQAVGGGSSGAQISRDGRYAVFRSAATNLVSGDSNGQFDAFWKDLVTGETRRVSVSSSGNQATGGMSYDPQLSADGRFVIFVSDATNLVAGDTNAWNDVFLKDLLTEETVRVSVDRLGNQGSNSSYGGQFSADGRYISFTSSATNLVSGDTNGQGDVFLTANPLAERYSLSLQYGVSLQTQSGAQYMQTYLDRELTQLSNYQGQLGAIQQRLGVAANVLSSMNENMAAAESRILDVDVAAESSTLARTQILQNVASAVLAQANQAPALALALLQ